AIRNEHLLLMPHVCSESISYLLGENGILEEIDKLYELNDHGIDNDKEGNNEINDIMINLSHILIESLDDAKVNLTPVIHSMLMTFLELPYNNDVKILEWCFNKSMQYFDDSAKIEHACSVINHINFRRDQSKVAETLFFNLDKEPYKNSPELQELIWKKLVVYVNDFNLSNREKTYLIQRIFNNVESLFNKVPVSILVNDIFMNDFFMKNTEMINWYFPRLLKSYEDEKIYFDKLGYNFNNKESNEEIMKNQPKDVIEEKLNNELKLRFRMMQTILKSEVNVSPFIDQQRLNTLNPPENLRIAIEKFGWKKKTITA
ncbi:TPA: protein YjgL, partial [Escherichia coli]